jgi:hypothetical protein
VTRPNLGDGIVSGDAGFIGIGHLDTVVELDAFDEFGQLISAFQAQPFFGSRLNQRKHHQFRGLLRQCALGSDRPVDSSAKRNGSSKPDFDVPARF